MVFSILLFSKISPQTLLELWTFRVFAAVYELSKITLWTMGVANKNKLFCALAIAMTIGSLVSSAVSIIGEQSDRDIAMAASYELSMVEEDGLKYQLDTLDDEIKTTNQRLASGVGIADDNRKRLDSLREERNNVQNDYNRVKEKRLKEQLSAKDSQGSKNPLSSLAIILRIDADNFRLYYTAFLTLMLELGGLATSAAAVRRRETTVPIRRYITVPTGVHILAGQSGTKTVCGRAFQGVVSSEIPTGRMLCPDCLQEVLK